LNNKHLINFIQVKTYHIKRNWKYTLLFVAVLIGAASLYSTKSLVDKMKVEERKKMEIWAEATKHLAVNNDLNADISFYVNVIANNKTIPVFLTKPTQSGDSIISTANIKPSKASSQKYLYKRFQEIKNGHEPIIIDLGKGVKNVIYYDDSILLRKLSIYPYVQLGVISLFVLIAYFAFSSSRKAEQNQVWVGMSKETAHQLGTPISSLNAWIHVLAENADNATFIPELEKDVARLNTIVERFSKIGSLPDLPLSNICEVMQSVIQYMQSRTSRHINITFNCDNVSNLIMPLNPPLFYWVIENLVKNAADAMDGKGGIDITLKEMKKDVVIYVSDTGKGIPKKLQQTIFKPGYTSKERGWGLGLSLTKRIVEHYHKGKITVQNSEIDKGTTFKITLPKDK